MAEPHLVDRKATFAAFAHLLDPRLLRALADMGFARPTLVQAKAIPLALESRDILARARTGSGKTAAYCLPVVQKIICAKTVGMSLIPAENTMELIVFFSHCPYLTLQDRPLVPWFYCPLENWLNKYPRI